MNLNEQYENIYRYFKTTTEPFDFLEWDGHTLDVIHNDRIIERYAKEDLKELKIL